MPMLGQDLAASAVRTEQDRPATAGQALNPRPLFRQEVLAFQQGSRQWGRVVPLQPVPVRAMTWFSILIAGAIIAFLCMAQYARKQTVDGYLVPSQGSARVFAQHLGVVSTVFVKQGDTVQQGQPLLSVLTGQTAGNGQDVNAVLRKSLEDQRVALNRRISEEVLRAETEHARLTQQIVQTERVIQDLEQQIGIQAARVALNQISVEAGAKLRPQGLVSDVDQRHRQEMVLQQQQALVALRQDVTTRRGQIAEVQFTLKQLPFTTAEKIQALRNELAATDQKLVEVNGHDSYIVRAPIAGSISLLQAAVGDVVDPKHLQMEILPSGSDLAAKLFIPVSAIGFVEPGRDVRLLLDAFPYQRFGSQRGKIVAVSQSVLLPSDAETPIPFKVPVYTATVTLDSNKMVANGKQIPLLPDMSLRADIILEKRSLLNWLFASLQRFGLER